MLIFGGINFPLAEFLLILAIIFAAALVYFAYHLKKLETLTHEEKDELISLEKMAQEEKSEIDKIAGFENVEKQDIDKFETEIKELEEDTETIYLKDMVPDVYRLQNYVLWALKKGIDVDEIKKNLESRGWKDKKLTDMVVDDMLKYYKYYSGAKGDVKLPFVKVEEKTQIIHPTKIINVTEPKPIVTATKAKSSKKSRSKAKKSSKEIKSVENEIKKIEKSLSQHRKKSEKKPSSKKAAKVAKVSIASAAKKVVTKKKAVVSPAKTHTHKSSGSEKGTNLVFATRTGDKFHRPSCIVVKNLKKEDMVSFSNKNQAMKKGYKPCTVCSVGVK